MTEEERQVYNTLKEIYEQTKEMQDSLNSLIDGQKEIKGITEGMNTKLDKLLK